MKKQITAFLLLLISAALAFGQDEDHVRDLFKSYVLSSAKGRPGARIRLELLRDGERSFVPLDTTFRAGDKVKLHFAINFPAYVEIYNRGSSGQLMRLFPYAASSALVKAHAGYSVPSRANEWFEFDNTEGAEQLSFIFSEARISPPVRSKPAPKPVHRAEPGIVVNNGNQPVDEQQLAINELNKRALDEGRDLQRVRVADEQYFFSEPPRLRRVLGVLVALNHQ